MATKSSTGKSSSLEKSVMKSVQKGMKQIPTQVKILLAGVLLAGILLGAILSVVISMKDRFDLVGQKDFTVEVGSEFTYTEEGVEAVCFGRDVSGKLTVSTTLEKDANGNYIIPTEVEGIYTIIYTVDAPKFNGKFSGEQIKRIRTFTVILTEEDERYAEAE